MQEQGPLNNVFKDKVLFYNVLPSGCLSEYLQNNNIRKGRRTIVNNPSDLDSKFYNFHIVKTSTLSDFEPRIKKYNKIINVEDYSLIGIVPTKIHENIEIKFDTKSELFDIEYKNQNFERHLKYVIDTLVTMDNHGFKIVIFPELFLFPDSLEYLRKFLCPNKFNNIELILTGSEWNKNKNSSYILSSSGTILNRHNKKIPYDHYCKEKGITYSENIEIDNTIEFLDIPGIGRIAYLICRDFLTTTLQNLCFNIMESNLLCVSAYTSKTDLMLDSSRTSARLYGVASILCNSCSALNDKENLLGYVVVPIVKNKTLSFDELLLSRIESQCTNCNRCFIIN